MVTLTLIQRMTILVDGEAEDELTSQHRLKLFKLTLLANSPSAPPSTSSINGSGDTVVNFEISKVHVNGPLGINCTC